MSEQADIEAALARATAAYKNYERHTISAEEKLLELRDTIDALRAGRDRLREALTEIAEANLLAHQARRIARAALAKEAGQ
jgi:hypothetical protein